MKKLIAVAAGALALGASVMPAQAIGPQGDSIWDAIVNYNISSAPYDDPTTDIGYELLEQLVLIVPGYPDMLDQCGNGKPFYTVFAPTSGVIYAVLDSLKLSIADLSTQSSVVKSILDDHIVNGSVSPLQLENDSVTLLTARSGFQIVVSDSAPGPDNRVLGFFGNVLVSGQLVFSPLPFVRERCNGFVYTIAGFVNSTPQVALEAANFAGLPKDGTSTANNPSGSSLPDTL